MFSELLLLVRTRLFDMTGNRDMSCLGSKGSEMKFLDRHKVNNQLLTTMWYNSRSDFPPRRQI